MRRLIRYTSWTLFVAINLLAVALATWTFVLLDNQAPRRGDGVSYLSGTHIETLSPAQQQQRNDAWNHLMLGVGGVELLLFGSVFGIDRWSRR